MQAIIAFLGNDLIDIFGDIKDVCIKHLKPIESVDEDTLDWINPARADKQMVAENSKARVMLVGKDIQYTETIRHQQKILIIVENPKLALSKIGNQFFVEKITPGIHQSASIHPDAQIGDNFYAGANVVVGNCSIGHDVILYPNVVIHDGVTIGNDVTIKSGAVLGQEGFGFERNEENDLIKFPQVGKLIIHDRVEIGANTCIDKGALKNTVIGCSTKINNLCHIAHNVVIGQRVVVTGQVNISGSSKIEDDVWIAPNASLAGHQTIGKGAVIGTGAVVTKDVPPGETWAGNPAKNIK